MVRRTDPPRLAFPIAIVAAVFLLLAPAIVEAQADTAPTGLGQDAGQSLTQELRDISGLPLARKEVRDALVRLPLAVVLGAALALRPRRRGQTPRNPLVVETQIMLAVVGAVIMMVVGASIARAFGIVGAANLIRYRSNIEDPKDAVVMLCALAVGLASGVGLYLLAPLSTVFMAGLLWVLESFEPRTRKSFELKVTNKNPAAFRPKLEEVLTIFRLDFELLAESDEELGYLVRAPLEMRTRDVSDAILLIDQEGGTSVEWAEKKTKK